MLTFRFTLFSSNKFFRCGRRSRSENVKWTRLPLAFAYRGPYLFVLHSNSVEVVRLTSTSFTSQETAPPSVFVEMPCPRYLGPAPENGTNYFLSRDNQVVDIVQLEAPLVLGEKDGPQSVHLDDLSLSGSEFSITPSVARILDQTDESINSASSSSSDVSFKRVPNNSEDNSRNKRVKFECDF